MNIPTLPANSTADFTAGWNAAIAAVVAANAPPVSLIDPSADLVALIAAAAPRATLTLTPGATYKLTQAAAVTVANLTLNLNGAILAMSGASVESSNIVIHGAGFTCFGGQIASGDVCFRTFATGTTLHDLTVPDDVIATLLLADVSGTEATISDSTIGYTSSETVYTLEDGTESINTSFAGSRGQDCWRSDNSPTGKIPSGHLIQNCDFDQRGNKQNNEAVSFRKGRGKIVGCTFQTYMRAGEINTPGVLPGANATVLVSGCNWPNIKFGFNQVQIAQGVVATVDGCTFAVDASQVPISVTPGLSSATLTNNMKIRTVAGMAVKSYLYGPQTTPANPLVVESGTQTMDPTPAAA